MGYNFYMDSSLPINPEAQLTQQMNKILSFRPKTFVSPQLIEHLESHFKNQLILECDSCQFPLFNQVCVYLYQAIYCQQCATQIREDSQDRQFFALENIETVNLGQLIIKESNWTFCDHLQFCVFAEEDIEEGEKGKSEQNLLAIGEQKMTNPKTCPEILQYLRLVKSNSSRKNSEILESYPSIPHISHQNLETSLRSFYEVEEDPKDVELLEMLKRKENDTLKMLKECVPQNQKNEKLLQQLDEALIAQAEQNFSIYNRIMKISRLPMTPTKEPSIFQKMTLKTEDLLLTQSHGQIKTEIIIPDSFEEQIKALKLDSPINIDEMIDQQKQKQPEKQGGMIKKKKKKRGRRITIADIANCYKMQKQSFRMKKQ